MPAFVDPRTGERYENVPEEEQERARSEFGLVPEEKYAKDKAYEALPLGEKVERGIAAGGAALGRGLHQAGKPLEAAGILEPWPQEFIDRAYGQEAQDLRAESPIISAAAEGAPIAAAGAGLGGAAVGLRTAAGLLGAESAASGISQEAIDATMEKRDFSAKSALWNGVLDLTFGALGYGAGKVLSFPGASAADEAVEGLPGKRNFIAEIDKGAVPEALGKREARSAGAAAAANRKYVGDASEEFTDDVWDAAVKSIDDQGLDAEARFFANPQTSNAMLELGAMNAADSLDDVRRVLRDDAGVGVKLEDWHRGAKSWTPDNVQAQWTWLDNEVLPAAKVARESIDGITGLGGYQSGAAKALDNGVKRVLESTGAQRNAALDQLKRSADNVIMSLANDTKTDLMAKKQLVDVMKPFADLVRDGLEDEAKFGANAVLQKVTNEPVARMVAPLSRVESKLSERLGPRWGEVGQAAQDKRTRAAAVKSLMQSEPSARREILQDLDESMVAIEDLAKAREAHGMSRLESLPRIHEGLKRLKSDLNMATVIQTAQRRAGEQTGGVAGLAADVALDQVAGRIPVIGGAAKRGAKGLLDTLLNAETLPKPGTPLRTVLDDRLKDYARLPELANAGFSRPLLSEQLRGMLRGKGGVVAGGAGAIGAGAAMVPGEAGAAELPEQRQKRQAFEQGLSALPPDQAQMQIAMAETLARVGAQTESRVTNAIGELFSGKPRSMSPRTRAIEKRAQELDVTRAVVRFMGPKEDDPIQAWKDKSALLKDVMSDPSRLARAMAENLGDMPRLQPEMFMKMVASTMATVEYLAMHAPQAAGKSVFDTEGYPPSLEEITSWAGRWVGALHPLDTIDDLASNDVLPEQTEAVKTLHPDAFALFQKTALTEISRIRKSRKRIPMQQLEQIDTALDLNGAGEPTLSWDMVRMIQMGEQQAAQTGHQPPSASPMQSKGAERVASSALGSIRPEAGAA